MHSPSVGHSPGSPGSRKGDFTHLTPKAWSLKGALHGLLGDREGAREALEEGVELEPANVKALSQAGAARAQLGHVDRAAELLERALAVDPDHAPSHRRLGRALLGSALLGQNDLAGAKEHLNPPCELGDEGVLSNLGETLRRMGDIQGAVEAFRRSLDLAMAPQTLQRLAWILGTTSVESLRDPQEAMELAELLNQNPHFQNAGDLETLAAANAASADFEAAARLQLEAIQRIAPDERETAEARLALYRERQAIREQGRGFRTWHRNPTAAARLAT